MKFPEIGAMPFVVYIDSALKNPLLAPFDSDYENGQISISPEEILPEEAYVSNTSNGPLFIPLSGNGSWGFHDTLYLAQYNDLETGDLLDKSLVTLVKVNPDERQVATLS